MIHGMLQPTQKTVPQSYRCWHQYAIAVTGYQPNSNKGMKTIHTLTMKCITTTLLKQALKYDKRMKS